jgi:methionyl-tRNA formyltransferase
MQTLIFLGSKPIGYYCLEFLIAKQHQYNFEIIGVLSNDNKGLNNDKSVVSLANEHHIPLISSLSEMPMVDILYSVQYHLILKPADIAKSVRAYNLHMAPLPEYRGCNQFSFAIINNAKLFGATIHVMDEKIDHGDIVAEARFEIAENIWITELYNQTEKESLLLFQSSLENIINNNVTLVPQPTLATSRGTSMHYRSDIQKIKQIDLNWDASTIERHIRATYMPGFEPPFCIIDNKKIYFTINA